MANPLDLPEGHRRTTAPAPPDTFPKLLRQHADVRGQQPAMREKDLGIWQSWNWTRKPLLRVCCMMCWKIP